MGTPQGLVARVGNLDAEQVVEMAPLGVLRVGMGSLGVTPPEPFRAGTRVMGFSVPRAVVAATVPDVLRRMGTGIFDGIPVNLLAAGAGKGVLPATGEICLFIIFVA